jgi:hypothetical protein
MPMISGLEAVQGRKSLGFPATWPNQTKDVLPPAPTVLLLEPARDGGDWVRFSVNACDDAAAEARTSDYLIRFRPADDSVQVVVNARMRERAADWLRTGRTRIDFASDSLIAAWKHQFSYTTYIRNDWADAPAAGERP